MVAAAVLTFPSIAGAANFVVGRTDDPAISPAQCSDLLVPGQCSLREAISTANAVSTVDVITLQPGATYQLTQSSDPSFESANVEGDLDLTDHVTIVGNGATVDASGLANRERVLELPLPGVNATLRDLTITGGAAAPPGMGGATHGPGGGVSIGTNGTVLLERVRITDNRVLSTVSTQGAGVSVFNGSVELRDSLIDGNIALGSNPGGGIILFGGSLTLTNTTVADNTDGVSSGGIRQFAGDLHLRNATVAVNAGNIRRNAGSGGTATNSIVANPTTGENCTMTGSAWSSSTGNVSSSAEGSLGGCAFGGSSLTGIDPGLAPLGDNGGTTPTMALVPGSRAIDAGSPDASLCPATDQRGQPRPNDGNGDGVAACDAGAVEAATVQPPPPPPGGGNPGGGGAPVTPDPPGDGTAPGLRFTGASRQAPLRRRNSIVFKARSTENGTITVGGSLRVPGNRRTYRFEAVTRRVTAGRTVTMKLLIPRRALSGVKRTLNRGRRINVTFTATAEDAAGNKTTAKRRVKLARR